MFLLAPSARRTDETGGYFFSNSARNFACVALAKVLNIVVRRRWTRRTSHHHTVRRKSAAFPLNREYKPLVLRRSLHKIHAQMEIEPFRVIKKTQQDVRLIATILPVAQTTHRYSPGWAV